MIDGKLKKFEEPNVDKIIAEIANMTTYNREKQLLGLRLMQSRLAKIRWAAQQVVDSVFSKTAMGDYMVRKEEFELLQALLKPDFNPDRPVDYD